MSIDTELVVKALRRLPQGLTLLEIWNHLAEEPEYKGKLSLFPNLLPKLRELRDSQVISHIGSRWSLIGAAGNTKYPIDTPESTNGEQQDYLESDESIQLDNFNEPIGDDCLVVYYDSPMKSLKLSIRASNCLIASKIYTVEDLQSLSDSQLINIKHLGQKSLDEIREVLSKLNPLPKLVKQHDYIKSDESIQLDNFNEHTGDDCLVVDSASFIKSLGLSIRTFNCLMRNKIYTIEDLQSLSDDQLINITNLGQKSLNEIREVLCKLATLPKFTNTKSEISVEDLPEWANIKTLEISTNDLLVEFLKVTSQPLHQILPLKQTLHLHRIIRQYSTIAHLIYAFETEKLNLDPRERVELTRIINPFRELRNVSQAYLDWLACLPISILVDILVKRKWTQDNLSEVYLQQILSVTPHDFRQSIYQDIISGKIPSKRFLTVFEEIQDVFSTIGTPESYVLQERLKFRDGKQRTLEDIAIELNITRERVRQIERTAKSKLKESKLHTRYGGYFLEQFSNVAMESLYSAGYIATLPNWTEEIEFLYPAGEIHLPSVISWFVEEQIAEVYTYKISDNQLFYYIAPISSQILSNIQTQISGFWQEQKISDRTQLHQIILPLLPEEISNPEKAANTLIQVFCQEQVPNVFSKKKWKMADYAYYVLYKAGKPLHFKEISDRIKQLKTDWQAKNTERAGQGLIDNHPDIIRSGSGIYGLREWGTMPYGHFREVLLDYLSKQPLPVDVDYIHAELSRKLYSVTLTTVKTDLDAHPHLFQKYSNFYGLKNRRYELSNQTLLNLLVAKLEAEPVSLVDLEQDSDLSEYRDIIYLYLNISPLFWKVGSFKDQKFALAIEGKYLYQPGDAKQLVADIFERIREPLHPKDFLRILLIYYAYTPADSAFSRILDGDQIYMPIIEALYIPRAWMEDEDLSPIIEDLDRDKYREVVKFTLGSKSLQVNDELVFDWLNFCYQNRFFYRGSLVFDQLDLSKLPEEKSAIARKIGQICQRNGDISALSFRKNSNCEVIDDNTSLDIEELREQAKSGERASSQGLATLEDGKHYVRYTTLNIEIHIEKWGGSTSAQMRVLKVLYRGEMFDPSKHNPIVNHFPIEQRLEEMNKLYDATLTAYGQVDSYLQIVIGSKATWGGVGYRNLKPIIDETS
ncbi:MAG: hypothetical protein LH649_08960 [Pseudanabaena sp. CAN_BIN31]|nr:hypothetical protein [Pseudanabaena sp. CAN_BIN31]